MKISYGEYWKDRSRRNYMSVRARHREIVRVIVKTKNSGKVLDLGCGEGHILKMLPASSEKYGIDISENVKKCHIEELTGGCLYGEIWTIDLQNGKHR